MDELYAVEVAPIHNWDLISLGNLASYTGIVQGISPPPPPTSSSSHRPLFPLVGQPPTYLSADYVLVYTHFDILVITPHPRPPPTSRLSCSRPVLTSGSQTLAISRMVLPLRPPPSPPNYDCLSLFHEHSALKPSYGRRVRYC